MIVLHGTWKPAAAIQERGDFFLWGESSASPKVKRRGRPRAGVPRSHPFQASQGDILKIITALDFANSGIKKARHDSVFITLPSISNSPQASPDLIREDDSENGTEKVGLAAWKIDGLSIPPEDAVSLLTMLSGFWTGIDGFAIGTDFRFWSKVSKFAMELLSKQHFVPGLVVSENNDQSFARWQYALNDQDDLTRMSMLAGRMPPICRSILQNGLSNYPEALLSDFLNTAVDGCIRRWIPISEIKTKTSGLSSAWLDSLATGEPIRTKAHWLKNLPEELKSWSEPIHEIERSGFRTCFRLEPPAAEADDSWNLRYFLQASDDPSLLVPAGDVWRESRDTLSFLTRKFDHPQEKLLADLGKASRLFPPIEESLNTARPEDAKLGTRQAYIFLKEAASLLSESGFGVLIPPWWNKGAAKTQLGIKLNVKPKREPKTGKGIFTFDSIISYNWQLALGGEAISEEEFERLSSLKEPLVRIRGQWVELKKDEIDAAIKFFRSKNSGEMKLSEAMKLSIGQGKSETGLSIVGFEAKGSLSSLFEQLSGRKGIKQIQQPDSFVGGLRPYQVKGFSWLAFLRQYGLGACLADDMGLGKTIQLLALLLKDKEEGNDLPVLLICPTSVVGNWQREAMKFAPSLRVLLHHGINRRKKEFLKEVHNYDLVISTYALTHRDEDVLANVEWNGVVLDEAQSIKNSSTKQSQAVRRIKAGYRIALTGTPVENRLSELWSIMEFLNPGYLGSAAGFRRTFALPIERYNDKEAGMRLRSIVTPFVLRRLKTDSSIIKDLPDKIEMKEHYNLTKEQATLYEAVVKDMLRKIEESEGIERKGAVLSALMRLKQVCNHPAQFLGDGSSLPERSGKLNRITEMLEEVLAEDDSVLIFTQFAEMGGMLKAHFQKVLGQEVLFLHGGVSQKQRDQMVMRFSEKNGPRIFILSLKAGGVGLNLTRANHVFHFDRWWNPAVENQATDRAFRIGQTKNVQVHKFICDGTLEERIDEMIEVKKELAENIIGTGEGWLTEMTTAQLKELFTLRRETVADE
ncbi:RNA polymerase-associated protein RapA [uncultured archaeon]|nr:RNA polymerase-associated protein RapA [uncultured archaeon]